MKHLVISVCQCWILYKTIILAWIYYCYLWRCISVKATIRVNRLSRIYQSKWHHARSSYKCIPCENRSTNYLHVYLTETKVQGCCVEVCIYGRKECPLYSRKYNIRICGILPAVLFPLTKRRLSCQLDCGTLRAPGAHDTLAWTTNSWAESWNATRLLNEAELIKGTRYEDDRLGSSLSP